MEKYTPPPNTLKRMYNHCWLIEIPYLKGICTWIADIQPPTIRCPFCKCMIQPKEKSATRTTRDPLEKPGPAYYLLDIFYRNYTLYLIELPYWVHYKRLCIKPIFEENLRQRYLLLSFSMIQMRKSNLEVSSNCLLNSFLSLVGRLLSTDLLDNHSSKTMLLGVGSEEREGSKKWNFQKLPFWERFLYSIYFNIFWWIYI